MSENYLGGLLSAWHEPAQVNNLSRLNGLGLLSAAVRTPYQSELNYFKSNPKVAGMAAEDDSVVLNPFSNLSETGRQSVIRNELARILMRNSGVNPSFNLTPQQAAMFQGTAYENNPSHAKQSILARGLSGDPSAGALTPEQSGYVNFLREVWGWK